MIATTLAIVVVYLALLVTKAFLALHSAASCPRSEAIAAHEMARVSIAQAILSGDPQLEAVLEDNVRALTGARFFWLVDDDDPTAQASCAAIKTRHPAARIEILTSPSPPPGANPKLFKLERMRQLVGDGVLVVLDDDTRLPATSLGALLSGLSRSEVSTGLPGYLDDGHWPSRLLAQFVNNNAALTYLPMLAVAPPVTINGMAYAIAGRTIDSLGGFAPMMESLTDDLAVARAVLAKGGRISQTASPHWIQTSVPNAWQYVRLMHRWFLFARLLFERQPSRMQRVIALLYVLPAILLWSALLCVLLAPTIVGVLGVVVLIGVRSLVLIWIQHEIYGRSLHRPGLSIVSELLQPLHLLHAFVSRRIAWRRRRYVVRDDRTFQAR